MIKSDPPLHLSYLIGRSEALSELAGLLERSEAALFRSLDDLLQQLDTSGRRDVAPLIDRITRERRELLHRVRDVRDEIVVESQLAAALAAGRSRRD